MLNTMKNLAGNRFSRRLAFFVSTNQNNAGQKHNACALRTIHTLQYKENWLFYRLKTACVTFRYKEWPMLSESLHYYNILQQQNWTEVMNRNSNNNFTLCRCWKWSTIPVINNLIVEMSKNGWLSSLCKNNRIITAILHGSTSTTFWKECLKRSVLNWYSVIIFYLEILCCTLCCCYSKNLYSIFCCFWPALACRLTSLDSTFILAYGVALLPAKLVLFPGW